MKKVIFYAEAYQALANKLVRMGHAELGSVERNVFPDGERYLRITHEVLEKDIILLAGAYDDSATLESFDLACGLVRMGARRLHIVIPYFGYSTMERAVKSGEVVTAKNRARLFSSIPQASYGNTLYAVDLHTGGLQYYFEGNLNVFHLYAKQVIIRAAQELEGHDFVLASTDAGRAKWVESLANDMSVAASFVYKRRLSGSETSISAVSAQVQDRAVIIYDDMIRTGGSLIAAAQAYLEAGAIRISAIATHGIFPGDAISRLQDCGFFQKIVVTDSHPRSYLLQQKHSGFLEVVSLAPVLSSLLE